MLPYPFSVESVKELFATRYTVVVELMLMRTTGVGLAESTAAVGTIAAKASAEKV